MPKWGLLEEDLYAAICWALGGPRELKGKGVGGKGDEVLGWKNIISTLIKTIINDMGSCM